MIFFIQGLHICYVSFVYLPFIVIMTDFKKSRRARKTRKNKRSVHTHVHMRGYTDSTSVLSARHRSSCGYRSLGGSLLRGWHNGIVSISISMPTNQNLSAKAFQWVQSSQFRALFCVPFFIRVFL